MLLDAPVPVTLARADADHGRGLSREPTFHHQAHERFRALRSGIPADQVCAFLVRGGPTEIAARLAAYGDSGAERVVVTIAGGDWHRQAELLAEARARLD